MTAPTTAKGKKHAEITSRLLRDALAHQLNEMRWERLCCHDCKRRTERITDRLIGVLMEVQSAINNGAYLGEKF